MQYPTEVKLKLNLLWDYSQTENILLYNSIKNPNFDPVTHFFSARATIIFGIFGQITLYCHAIFWEGGALWKEPVKNSANRFLVS